MQRKIHKTVFIIAPLLGIALLVFGAISTGLIPNPLHFNDKALFISTYPQATVDTIWTAYRDTIQKDGRTLDRDRNYLTTSEGQSYSLLRAVWMDDKQTFDRVWRWTENNLQKREGDSLFAWLWGQNEEGRWDVLRSEGGGNSASDADQDIALALIFAHKRWNQDHYLEEALKVLEDIWEEEVILVNGRPYLLAGNWANDEPLPTVNPSYLFPAAYPIFAEVDPSRDWMALKDTSYDVLEKATWNALSENNTPGLPPDWVGLDPVRGEIRPSMHPDKTTDFADDAFRVLWRVALDAKWHNDPRAFSYLNRLTFFEKEWAEKGRIYGRYTHGGEALTDDESASMYGSVVAHFSVVNPPFAEAVYREKLSAYYDPDTENLRDNLGYYAQNWVWFGFAYYADRLENLSLIR